MFSALVSPVVRNQANVSFTVMFHFFPIAAATRIHVDEQTFIFRVEIFAFALPPDLILRRRASAVSMDEWRQRGLVVLPAMRSIVRRRRGACHHCASAIALVAGPRYARTRWRLLTMRVYGPTGVARKRKVAQSFRADLPGPVLCEKRILFSRNPNQPYNSAHPVRQRGVGRRHERWGRLRWTR